MSPRRASLAHVRAAKAAGLPVTCDVTPHHLALTDEWIAGLAALGVGRARRGRRRARPVDGRLADGGAVRPGAARQPAAPLARGRRGLPGRARRRDRRRDRDRPRAPHRGRQARRVRLGGERDQRDRDGDRASSWRRSRRDGCRSPARSRPSRPARPRSSGAAVGAPGLREGEPADLVVIDRGATWTRRRRVAALEGQELAAPRPRAPRRRAADARRRPGRLRRGLTSGCRGARRHLEPTGARQARAAAGEHLAGDRVDDHPADRRVAAVERLARVELEHEAAE